MTAIRKRTLSRSRSNRGFTLVEVLVALVVLSLGLLGLAALQLTSLQFNTNSYFRTQATVVAYDIIDRMRSNPTGFADNAYHVPTTTDANNKVKEYSNCTTCNCDSAACSTSDLALYDLGKWYMRTGELLPESAINRPTINRDPATNEVTILIKWKEKDVPQSKSWTVRL